MFMFRLFICCTLCAVIASSCTKQRPLENFNFYGGISRSGNYELGGTFTTMVITDIPKKYTEDLPKGAAQPPIPVSFNHNYLTTIDGYAIRYANGIVEWKAPLDSLQTGQRAVAAAAAAADKEDNLYLLANDGAVYSFDKNGKRRWKSQLFTPTSNSIFSDILILQSGIIAAFSDNGTQGTILKISFDGKTQWQRTSTLAPTRTVAADTDDNIVCALSHNTPGKTDSIITLTADGKQRWGIACQQTRILKSPILGAGLVLASGIKENEGKRSDVVIACEAASGKTVWSKELTFTPQGISVGTQANNDGALVVIGGYRIGVGEPLTLLYGFDASGKELWRLSYNLAIIGAPMISTENIAFVGTQGDAVGVYLMDKKGTFNRVISLSDAPLLCLLPGVDAQNNLVFSMSEQLGLIKVGSLPAQRLLPY